MSDIDFGAQSGASLQLVAPAGQLFAIAPSDSADLPMVTRGIYVGITGNLAVRDAEGNQVVLVQVQAGSVLPIRASRVLASGTTASSIVGMV
jgi:hypothetical protein